MRDFGEIWNEVNNILGNFSQIEASAMYNTIKDLPKGSEVVEIGSYCGRSSALLGMMGMDRGWNLTYVDPFITATLEGKSSRPVFIENMKRLGIKYKLIDDVWTDHTYEDLDEGTRKAGRKFKKKIDFLFIDGNHIYNGVKTDCEVWLPKVKTGRAVAFHDYQSSWDGVKQAVDEVSEQLAHGQIFDTMLISIKL